MEELRFQITDEMEDERIDKCMSLLVENLSRSFIQKLIKDGNVLVNGKPVKGSYRVKCEDEVVFSVPESVEPDIEPENIPLDILYEDEDILVLNKPADMPVHPSAGNYENTLANGVAWYYKQQGENFVYRCINRLDRDTTGVLVLAKNPLSGALLSAQMKQRQIRRTYLALTDGKGNCFRSHCTNG